VVNTAPIPIVHFVVAAFVPAVAWVLTILTALTSFWMWAEYRATQARPISLDSQTLYLRYGTLTDLRIPIIAIHSARGLRWQDCAATGPRTLPRPIVYQGMGAANVEFALHDGTVYRIGVDQPAIFLAELQARQTRLC
jgi:hypothetical protein